MPVPRKIFRADLARARAIKAREISRDLKAGRLSRIEAKRELRDFTLDKLEELVERTERFRDDFLVDLHKMEKEGRSIIWEKLFKKERDYEKASRMHFEKLLRKNPALLEAEFQNKKKGFEKQENETLSFLEKCGFQMGPAGRLRFVGQIKVLMGDMKLLDKRAMLFADATVKAIIIGIDEAIKEQNSLSYDANMVLDFLDYKKPDLRGEKREKVSELLGHLERLPDNSKTLLDIRTQLRLLQFKTKEMIGTTLRL